MEKDDVKKIAKLEVENAFTRDILVEIKTKINNLNQTIANNQNTVIAFVKDEIRELKKEISDNYVKKEEFHQHITDMENKIAPISRLAEDYAWDKKYIWRTFLKIALASLVPAIIIIAGIGVLLYQVTTITNLWQ